MQDISCGNMEGLHLPIRYNVHNILRIALQYAKLSNNRTNRVIEKIYSIKM